MNTRAMRASHSAPVGVLCILFAVAASCSPAAEKPSGAPDDPSGAPQTPDSPSQLEPDDPADQPEDGEEPSILSVEGWLESVAVTWAPHPNATAYNVYYKGGAAADYTQIDAPLVRNYGGYYRADIPGVAAGAYTIKVAPVVDGKEGEGAVRTATAAAHDRSGYAFYGGKTPGGYTMDGTPKANARIIYVTDQNKDSVTLGVNVEGKGDETLTGIYPIINGHRKGNETRPLVIRLIGQIHIPASTDKGDIVFDTKNAADAYITLEGVGNDATADGWGARLKNASNIEISNIGFMNTASEEGDDVGLQQKNYYIWVHNCDLFYGQAGSDADQAKGDGAMDAKGSTYVTFSYNHFWDTGKTHLIGNKETGPDGTPGLLTLHHNWYDHSDSRHPRARVHTAHVYNNYYDGVSKYGIGATYGCSVFAEGNYFRNAKYPMLISMQGSDTGTFSSEDGGIIKAYNNYMSGQASFVAYGSANTTQFDAYVAATRSEIIPAAVKTLKGAHAYNNFDTAGDFYAYTPDEPQAAKDKVMQYAGRMGGGDFKWTFTGADDSSYSVDAGLQAALTSYQTALVGQ